MADRDVRLKRLIGSLPADVMEKARKATEGLPVLTADELDSTTDLAEKFVRAIEQRSDARAVFYAASDALRKADERMDDLFPPDSPVRATLLACAPVTEELYAHCRTIEGLMVSFENAYQRAYDVEQVVMAVGERMMTAAKLPDDDSLDRLTADWSKIESAKTQLLDLIASGIHDYCARASVELAERRRRARLDARPAPTPVPEHPCVRCNKRPRHFGEHCKRCANDLGLRPTGKVA